MKDACHKASVIKGCGEVRRLKLRKDSQEISRVALGQSSMPCVESFLECMVEEVTVGLK